MGLGQSQKISKREFLRRCAMCAGVLAFDFSGLEPLAALNTSTKMKPPVDIWKWNKIARYFTRTEKGARCDLCPNACVVPPAGKSLCKTRVNFRNDLYSIAYGNPCSVNVDPIEKKPLFHFLPQSKALSLATAGCNFTCLNCQNWQISQVSPFETENYDLFPDEVVAQALKTGCKSIAFTYSEPVVFYEYVYDTAVRAREKGIKSVFISNGYLNEKPLRDLCEVTDAANINLKGFSSEIYRKLNGGDPETVKRSLRVFHQSGVWLEITNLVIPGWTDDMSMIGEMCRWLVDSGLGDCPLHFNRFFPMYKLTQVPATPDSTLNRARETALKAGIKYVYIGNVPGTTADDTYCPKCGKLIVDRKGYVVLANHIKNNACPFCGNKIEGVWQ